MLAMGVCSAKLYYSTVKIYIRLKKDAHDLLTAIGDGSMAKLTDLGFTKGIIFETIVSTYNPDGTPNAAPMGVTMQDNQTLCIDLFNSQTLKNLQANKCGVINLSDDVEIFYRTAFKEANLDGNLPREWFAKAYAVNAPELRSANATVDVSVTSMEQINAEKTKVLCKVERINATQKYPEVYCRAMSATLEAIIHATRVKAFAMDENKQQQVRQLLDLIANCNDVVNHTAPDSQYSLVMADLTRMIASWRNKP